MEEKELNLPQEKELDSKTKRRLTSLINECAEVKKEKKKQTDIEKVLVDDIKRIMGENNIDDAETDNFIAQYRITKSEDLDVDMALAFLINELGETAYQLGIVVNKPVLDATMLEKAIYRGDLSEDIVASMAQFKKITRTPKLTIKTKKGAK